MSVIKEHEVDKHQEQNGPWKTKNIRPVLDFLSSRETYEKYERPHIHNFAPTATRSSSGLVTYNNEYGVTRTPAFHDDVVIPLPQHVIPKYVVETHRKSKTPLCRITAAAIGIPLLIMICLFVAIWFQELGFI